MSSGFEDNLLLVCLGIGGLVLLGGGVGLLVLCVLRPKYLLAAVGSAPVVAAFVYEPELSGYFALAAGVLVLGGYVFVKIIHQPLLAATAIVLLVGAVAALLL